MAAFSTRAVAGLLLMLLGEAAEASAQEPLVSREEALGQFELFKTRFSRNYGSLAEEVTRLENFATSLDRITAHNAQEGRSFDMSINEFADMSDEEFSHSVLMEPQTCSATTHTASPGVQRSPRGADLPKHVDWRESGVVSEVKNQGRCGSCWTFSTTGCLEAHMAIKYDAWHAPLLSEQQLVDCAQAFDNHGCDGGLPSHAFEYIKAAGGLDTEFHYPYHATDGKCVFSSRQQFFRTGGSFEPTSAGIGAQVVGGSVNITVGDEAALKYHLATHGPVSIAFQVASDFRYFGRGVYSSTLCKNGPGDVNHAVLAVGYGTDPDTQKDYWLVKNSWDYTWGDEGFFKIEAFKNMCGVADCMAFPDLYGLNKVNAEEDEFGDSQDAKKAEVDEFADDEDGFAITPIAITPIVV